jgi:hypothetical protein
MSKFRYSGCRILTTTGVFSCLVELQPGAAEELSFSTLLQKLAPSKLSFSASPRNLPRLRPLPSAPLNPPPKRPVVCNVSEYHYAMVIGSLVQLNNSRISLVQLYAFEFTIISCHIEGSGPCRLRSALPRYNFCPDHRPDKFRHGFKKDD